MVQLPPSSCHWPLALRALSTDARSRLDSLNLRIVCRFIPAHCFLAFFAGGLVAGVRTPLLSCVRVPFPRCEPVRNLQPRDSCIMSLTAYSWCRCRLLLIARFQATWRSESWTMCFVFPLFGSTPNTAAELTLELEKLTLELECWPQSTTNRTSSSPLVLILRKLRPMQACLGEPKLIFLSHASRHICFAELLVHIEPTPQ